MSDNNPSPTWTREPATLSAAIKRIATLQQHIYWLNDEIASGHSSWETERAEVRHLEGVITQRWNANDGRLVMRELGCGVKDCTVVGCVGDGRAELPAGTHGPRDARSSEERANASDDDANHPSSSSTNLPPV